MRQAIFLISTADRKGILAETTTFFYQRSLNILECRQYTDVRENAYYMRIAVELPPDVTRNDLENQFTVLAEKLSLKWSVYYNGDQQNVAVLVSKTSHCFYDLLMRSEEGNLGGKVVVAVGNHPDLEEVADRFKVPYYCLPTPRSGDPDQENALLELQHKMGTTKAEQNSFVQEWRNKISEDMVSVDRNLTSVKKEYDKVARLIEYVYLRAPCESVVHEIASFSPGSAVQEAEALITLIPLNGEIELECKIRPQDIGKIKVGSKSRIKLSAYPFQKYGTLDGTVRTISENTFQEQSNALEAGAYYRTRVTVSGKLNTKAKDFRLIPGMEAQCEIKCDRRRVIEYVLYPLIKALDEAGREP